MNLSITGSAIAWTIGAAVVITGIQLLLKWSSQPDLPGASSPNVTREDFAAWPEWVVAACITLAVFAGKLVYQGTPLPREIFLACLAVVIGGCVILPTLVRWICRDRLTGKYKSPAWIFVADSLGLGCIGVVAALGVRLYA